MLILRESESRLTYQGGSVSGSVFRLIQNKTDIPNTDPDPELKLNADPASETLIENRQISKSQNSNWTLTRIRNAESQT